MRHIDPLKAGLSVGAVIGLWHLAWVTLVGLGWAQSLMDFILRLHFLSLDIQLLPFSFVTAATLVFLAASVGIVLGTVFALIWNWLAFESAPEWARDKNVEATGEAARLPH